MFTEKNTARYKDGSVYIESIGYKTSTDKAAGSSFYTNHLDARQSGGKTAAGTLKEFFLNLIKSPIDLGKALIAYDTATPDELDAMNQAIADKFHTSVDSVKNCLSDKDCHNRFTLAMLQTSASDSNQLGLNILTSVIPAGAVAKAVRGADELTAAAKAAGIVLTNSDRTALAKLAKLGPEIPTAEVINDAKASGKTVTQYLRDCYNINSFDPFTEVWTAHGLFPIGNLNVGDFVLSYNEATGQTGYYPITAVHRNMDPALTYLWVKNNATGAKEMITTTPEHPFYLAGNVDGSSRPVPIGHADLSTRWVGAGHLKEGDRLRMADGSLGSVVNVTNVQETREMFNLTVDTAHTFYVGNNGWLVHNQNLPPACPIIWNPVTGKFEPGIYDEGKIVARAALARADAIAGPVIIGRVRVGSQAQGFKTVKNLDLSESIERVSSDSPVKIPQFPQDGTVFSNNGGVLPNTGNNTSFTEWVVPTPGRVSPGSMRLIKGDKGGLWFTPSHYEKSDVKSQPTFFKIRG